MGINQILQSDMKIGVQSPPPIPQNNIHWDRLGVDMPLFMWILSFHLLSNLHPNSLKDFLKDSSPFAMSTICFRIPICASLDVIKRFDPTMVA